jgi:hypothetical protein
MLLKMERHYWEHGFAMCFDLKRAQKDKLSYPLLKKEAGRV